MSSINSVRIPGLATGMDTDQMIKDMLIGEQNKVDGAKQKEQITKWQQETYRDIIKSVKGLYDKYFSATSPDFILSSKIYNTVIVNSSNNSIISANAGAGANKIDYKFKVDEVAKPPTLESKPIDKNKTLGEQGFITGESSKININGQEIELKATDKVSDVVKKVNDKFANGEVKASYSEMTGKLTIEGGETGLSSKLSFSGELFNNLGMTSSTGNSTNSIKLDESKTLKEQGIEGSININGTDIIIGENDTVSDLATKISTISGVEATYDKDSGKLMIKSDGELKLSGEALENMGIDTKFSNVESSEIEKNAKLGLTGEIIINGTKIEGLTADSTVEDLVKKINESKSGVEAIYDQTTKKLMLQSKEDLEIIGLDSVIDVSKIDRGSITGNEVSGSNNKVTVYANDGKTIINTISEENNSFTIDNITYNVNGVSTGDELVSMTSTTDTKQTVEKVQSFIDDYNKVIDEIYSTVTEKKNRDYEPLTEAQRKEMSEDEIKQWEEKAKEGLLRNDSELRSFMEDIKKAIFAPIGDSGLSLNDIGITTNEDYNKQGQLTLDVDKFTKALKDNGDLVYEVATEAFGKIKDVTYEYAGSSAGIFVKKAGMENSSTEINNLFSEQLRKQEDKIKDLTRKMSEKEESLYKKFALLESNMNALNAQMSYLMSSMGM